MPRGQLGIQAIANGRMRIRGDAVSMAGLIEILGMVLGRKFGLTAEIERQFQAGGLYHLVVVSGFNLAVVAGVALWLSSGSPTTRSIRPGLRPKSRQISSSGRSLW